MMRLKNSSAVILEHSWSHLCFNKTDKTKLQWTVLVPNTTITGRHGRNHSFMNGVNQEKTLPLGRKTIIYGQTPVAIRKSQLIDMARASGMAVEDFAKFILKSNAQQKLECLRLYHTSKLQQLSHLFDELDTCLERSVDEIRIASHCSTSTNGNSNEERMESKTGNASSDIHSTKRGMRKKGDARSNVRIQKEYDKRYNPLYNPENTVREKPVRKNQVTIISDTDSDQSDAEYIQPSPESCYSQKELQRPLDIVPNGNNKDTHNQHLEKSLGKLPTKCLLGTPPSSSSASSASSLFDPLIGKHIAHSSFPEGSEQTHNITHVSDYNQFLDTLFDSTSSNNVESNSMSNRYNTISHCHNSYQGKSNGYQENEDCNKVLDTILFGESPCSTQSQYPCGNSEYKNLEKRKEPSSNLDLKSTNITTKSNSQENAEELNRRDNRPTSIVPSSFELGHSPWGTLEQLFDD
ncbi:uncharacterized protein LOC125030546 isoform X2 [Penaeus chinensis]|uniref:uncharacterized protein LOC125030546 isoform X2 n=1 Tax=Penaeus chinensis TaxID=139456 RepID=UPI001FB69A96|nr:uncharacterized protein LOC125030546 isoform X2 [Penaeus chinensis]